jgi:hypothetical protein
VVADRQQEKRLQRFGHHAVGMQLQDMPLVLFYKRHTFIKTIPTYQLFNRDS